MLFRSLPCISRASAFSLCAANESGAVRPSSCAVRVDRSEYAWTTTNSTSGSLGNCLRSKRMNSVVESRSSTAREQRTPSTPASFRISAAKVLLIACLRPEMLSRQCPCSARLTAFSGDKGTRDVGTALDVCAETTGANQRLPAKARNTAVFPKNLAICK